MALVGTVSGSNGTSTTAISGSLIIADEPAARFPALASGVKFFVSGSKTSVGADSPTAIFGGDTFVSGALGTDSYFQMKPVGGLRVPTNTTASYIYTSGSTNDLYFTQYQPGTGYTNTTRLRWIESVLGTGVLHGAVLSTANGSTTFSVTSGSGIIVSQNASVTTDPYPTIVDVKIASVTSQSLTYVATNQITYITVDSAGTINQSPSPPTIAQKSSNFYLGRILHQSGGVTNGALNEPGTAYAGLERVFDFTRSFGPLKVSGHTLAVSQSSGLGTLGLTKTAGDSYVEGRNYSYNPDRPNLITSADDAALNDCKIFREYLDGSGDPVILTNSNAGYAVIDPAQYNNGGTLAAVGNSEWTNQRVFWYPRSVNRALYVYYGQKKYTTLVDAIGGIGTETFTEGANTQGAAIFVGVVTVKGNETDLSSVNTQITPAALHRGAGFGGGGGGTTSPGGSDTYVQFNDAGSFGGDAGFKYNKTTDTVTVGNLVVTGTNTAIVSSGAFEVKGGSGAVVGSITTGGVISGSGNFLIGGTVVVQGEAHVTGNLKMMNSIGDEGGEIFLNKAVTNTTIAGGVTIDVYQNRLRFFEQGGSSRGYYVDITGGGGGAGTNLASAASPGGSDTYVQYNDASAFGGDATFTFNETTKTLSASTGSFFSLTGSALLVNGGAKMTDQLRVNGVNNSGPTNFGFNGFTANFNFTSQSFVGVDTALGSYTGTLPVISGEYVGRLYNVKDVGGACATNAFVITASSPNKIDGATELKLTSTSGSVSLIAGISGSSYNWYIMSYV